MNDTSDVASDLTLSEATSSRVAIIRDRLISVFLMIMTFLSFVVAWPSRDHELVVRLSRVADDKPTDLYTAQIFCTILPDCFRASHKIILGIVRLPIEGLISLLYAMQGPTTTAVPIWAPQYVRNLGPYLVLRAILLVAIAYALHRYFRRWWTVALVANLLLWWSAGSPIRGLVRLYGQLEGALGASTLGSVLNSRFSMNSTIYLLEYDYIAFALLLWFPFWLQQGYVHRGTWRPLVLGLALAMTFEHLAPVYVVALIWLAIRRRLAGWLRPTLLVSVGWFVYIIGMILYVRFTTSGEEFRLVSITRLGYQINREGEAERLILRFIAGFLLTPFLLGRIFGALGHKLGLLRVAASNARPYINAVVLGLCLSFFVGFFHSALITEFGRQTIAAQVLLFISGILKQSDNSRTSEVSSAVIR